LGVVYGLRPRASGLSNPVLPAPAPAGRKAPCSWRLVAVAKVVRGSLFLSPCLRVSVSPCEVYRLSFPRGTVGARRLCRVRQAVHGAAVHAQWAEGRRVFSCYVVAS
jgi:hypothetical protein